MPDFAKFYDIMKTLDGFVTVIVISDDEFADFARAVGKPELAKDARFTNVFLRLQNAEALKGEMKAVMGDLCDGRNHQTPRSRRCTPCARV